MGARDFTKSGAFVAIVFALVVVLVPFGIEQIGEATGLFKFPATKTVKGWFSPESRVTRGSTATPVDWERYRKDLEEFSEWIGKQKCAVIFLPQTPEEIIVNESPDEKPVREMWTVQVTSCTAGDLAGGREKGYVFISGLDGCFEEGAVIKPSEKRCGYEIVHVGERTVWFRAIFEDEGDKPMGLVKFPEFTRVERDCLVRWNSKYIVRDAFPLQSRGFLMLDSLAPPDSVVFKLLDEKCNVVASILCVVIGEKGGRP